jgi:beta-lactamase regulating signal transducer with metallopeptidase domain
VNLLVDEIGRRLISSIFTTGLWFLFSMAILSVFRIRNPGFRYVFILLPLLKGLVNLMRVPQKVGAFKGAFVVSAQWPYARDLTPTLPDISTKLPATFTPNSAILVLSVYLIGVFFFAFLIWRIIGLIKFERILSHALEVDRIKYPEVYRTMGHLVEITGINHPKLISINSREAPFTLGITQPIIVVSLKMLNELSVEETEAVLAHEVAHIARKDHLSHWPVVIIRDLLFFNPLTYSIYNRLSFEKERACDEYGSHLTAPLGLAKGLVKMAELKKLEPSLNVTRTFAPQSLVTQNESLLARRVNMILENEPRKHVSVLQRIPVTAIFLFLFFVEIHLIIMINNAPLVLS